MKTATQNELEALADEKWCKLVAEFHLAKLQYEPITFESYKTVKGIRYTTTCMMNVHYIRDDIL